MVESGPLPEGTVRFPHKLIHEFITSAFRSLDVPQADARLMADVLVSADIRGIRSHGCGRLVAFMNRLEKGVINKSPQMEVRFGSDVTGTLDADNGLGPVAADRAMEEALERAGRHGAGFMAVCNCSHLGYVGYWAKKAMERGFIGISMTNGGGVVIPTFGIEPVLGTNPMSVAFPGGPDGHSFHLDMATSTVARGKVETTLREGTPLPSGWISEAFGPPHLDENSILSFDTPLLPLGGEGDETGGHKGYGLSLMVELFCSVLAGSNLQDRINAKKGNAPPGTGQFMGALKGEGFRDSTLVFGQIAQIFDTIRNSEKASGRNRIFIHGEPEAIAEEENRRLGIPLTPAVLEQVRGINERFQLGFKL